MNRTLAVVVALTFSCGGKPRDLTCEAVTGLPVFPGAEGYGTNTPGGRGGKVIEVTSLANAGAGSFREAVSAKGPRIVVFRVAGIITLESQLDVREPFLTVAGQTAPGQGVFINGAGLTVFTHDVVLQHLRVRPGEFPFTLAQDNDAIAILGPTLGGDAHHVVIDHVSIGWSEDEILSVYGGARDVTVSWSYVTEGFASPRHPKGAHSAGLLYADGTTCGTVHHTLLAHNGFRNPLLQGGGRFDVVNNVIYDWKDTGTELTPRLSLAELNVVNNVYLAGPSTNPNQRPVNTAVGHPVNHLIKAEALYGPTGPFSIWAKGNTGPFRPTDEGDEFAIVATGYGKDPLGAEHRAAQAFETPRVTTTPTAMVLETVLQRAGARPEVRDSIDTRVAQEVRDRSGRIIGTPEEGGGFPTIMAATPPADGDHDGMPDAWESSHGTDPADATDGAKDLDGDGYTNVEEYLHSLQ